MLRHYRGKELRRKARGSPVVLHKRQAILSGDRAHLHCKQMAAEVARVARIDGALGGEEWR
jgi:hypothetical protein